LAIVYDRAGWQAVTGEVLADPARRGDVRHVLPHFGEPLADRVWIGNNLVTGVPGYSRPLKAVKDAGDVAARVLLALYAGHAMDAWGGCDPTTTVCRLYQPAARPPATTVAEVHLGAGSVMTAWQPLGISACDPMLRAGPWASWQEHTAAGGPLFTALRLLESLGLVYEVALAVNRRYSATRMPADIEPLYELAARLPPGYDGRSEAGMQRAIATTLDELGHVLDPEPAGGHRVIAPDGQPHQVLGVYRLRFRVSNPKNAGVKGAWARIHNGTVDARQRIAQIRSSAGLQPL
jgi:hypothetical protein